MSGGIIRNRPRRERCAGERAEEAKRERKKEEGRLTYSLNIPVAKANIVQPPSGETKVTITESVRDYDVYILNTVS